MEALLRSLKNSQTQTSAAYYIFVTIVTIFSVLAIVLVFFQIKLGSLTQLQQTFPNMPFDKLLYGIAAAIVIMILLMLFNSQFEVFFQKRPSNPVDRPLPTGALFWKPATMPNPQDPINLQLVSDDFPMTTAERYSISVEMNVADSRSSDKQGPYRHILHRGTGELFDFKVNSPGSVPKGRGDLNDGLPTQMNPGVFLDPYTNDLLVYVDTDPIEGGQAYRESVRIPDIPLKRPFHLHITVHDQILEVYINCRLAATKFLNGLPRAVPNDWYGRIGFARAAAVIQNMKLYDTDMFAFEIMKMCPPISMSATVAPSQGCCTK